MGASGLQFRFDRGGQISWHKEVNAALPFGNPHRSAAEGFDAAGAVLARQFRPKPFGQIKAHLRQIAFALLAMAAQILPQIIDHRQQGLQASGFLCRDFRQGFGATGGMACGLPSRMAARLCLLQGGFASARCGGCGRIKRGVGQLGLPLRFNLGIEITLE